MIYSILLYTACHVSASNINRAEHYLTKYGYLDSNKDIKEGLEAFQALSGLAVTGNIDPATESQMLVPRCGARDDNDDLEMTGARDDNDGLEMTGARDASDDLEMTGAVLRYRVTKYPVDSLMTDDSIDNAILTAANLWKNDVFEIVKNEDDDSDNDVDIVFCDFTECVADYSVENDGEELARPVKDKEGKVTLYLDSTQSWADDSTLSQLSYGGVMHLQVQLLQVMIHQFGHLLGLHHTHRMSSSMVPFYMEWVNMVQPDNEDLMAVSRAQSSYFSQSIIIPAIYCTMQNLLRYI